MKTYPLTKDKLLNHYPASSMDMQSTPIPSFAKLVNDYINTGSHNDSLHKQLTDLANSDSLLKSHRGFIESNRLGFGDPAFHAMWLRLVYEAVSKFDYVRAMEIGVYKGQVISLWSLLAKTFELPLEIHAITPLQGNPKPNSSLLFRLAAKLNPRLRERIQNGNFYDSCDYFEEITNLFKHFGIDFGDVVLHKGLSTDQQLIDSLEFERYHIIYIDGDHTYKGAVHDIKTFAPKIIPGGWLVVDDAGCDLPGSTFWKGHKSVSKAVKCLSSMGFVNVLNVGHNRIYQKDS